ncbi:SFT2-domain-containing protein [Flagelloscypha sp. PMI_526]|nr:SFT2-domain-containing protein [Flagelloscypha sp. PMI_526]
MASESAFQANLSQFRWARDQQQQAQQPQPSSSGNPFSRFYSSLGVSSYIPLRSSETSNEDEAWFALSRWERLLGFGACLIGAAVCFAVAFLTLPLLAINPRKFALAFSLGSLLVMFGFSILIGPINHIKHLVSKERLPFTAIYFGSLAATLYFSIGVKSWLGSIICGIIQVIALVAYVLAYFPGGITTLRFGGQVALQGASSLLPR